MALHELTRPVGLHMVTLRSDRWEVDVLPGTGAALAAGRIHTDDGVWRDLLRPTPHAALTNPERCASFPMLPWSNRIDAGLLLYGGRTWQLQRNGSDGTAIHGALRHAPWQLVAKSDDEATLQVDSAGMVGVNFPWRFTASVGYALRGNSLVVTTSLLNADVEAFPAGFGHHPYFVRSLLPVGARPHDEPGEPLLRVGARAGYTLLGGLATGAAGAIPPRADFRSERPVGAAHIDDVLTDRAPGPLATLRYDSGVTVRVDADAAYSHVVLYAPRRRGYLAIEPVTHVNGGFALREAGVPGTGVTVLSPGDELTATFQITAD